MGFDQALTLLDKAERKDAHGTPVKLFMALLRSQVQQQKDAIARTPWLQQPAPLVRTDDVLHLEYWKARVRGLATYQAEEITRTYPPDKLRQVGSSLVPHYDEDQPGDKYQQMDAADAKRLPYEELVARLMA
jgi:hypothetical protein